MKVVVASKGSRIPKRAAALTRYFSPCFDYTTFFSFVTILTKLLRIINDIL